MGQVVSLEAHRRRRLAPAAPGGAALDPIDRLDLAVHRLDAALHAVARAETVDDHEIASELRAVTGAVASRRYLDAARRAERLLARLRRTS